uniref:LSM family member 14B n=1 Tax=Salarias fasciatus TaxID=181472 RepID=A0A672IS11_SALFA
LSSIRGTPYIGSKISLISKAQIRYEGILSSVDTDRSTVALAKVKSHGTEHRPTDRPVPPKDEIYEYIIFRGSDIRDITVSEPPKPHHGLPRDPAIVQSSLGGSSAGYHPRWSPYREMMPNYNQLAASSLLNQQYNAALGLGLHAPVRRAPTVEQAVQTVPLASAAQRKGKTATPPQTKPVTRPPPRSGRTGVQVPKKSTPTSKPQALRTRNQGQLLVKNPKATTLEFDSDFDFETANAQFKDDLTKEVVGAFSSQPDSPLALLNPVNVHLFLYLAAVEKTESEARDGQATQEEETIGEKFYDKAKCFFDNISSDLKPRRTTWAEEKKLNIETFGVPGRFLRGRGFRGRGRKGQSTPEQRAPLNISSARV